MSEQCFGYENTCPCAACTSQRTQEAAEARVAQLMPALAAATEENKRLVLEAARAGTEGYVAGVVTVAQLIEARVAYLAEREPADLAVIRELSEIALSVREYVRLRKKFRAETNTETEESKP